MLHNLLLAILIATNMGAFGVSTSNAPILEKESQHETTNKKIPIKKELETLPFDFNIDTSTPSQFANGGGTHYINGDTNVPTDAHYSMARYYNTFSNNVMMVKTNTYQKLTTFTYVNSSSQYPDLQDLEYHEVIDIPMNLVGEETNITYFPTTAEYLTNTYMMVLQITPYGALVNVGSETNIDLSIYFDYFNTPQYRAITRIISSVDTRLAKYVDAANWTSPTYVENAYNEIHDGSVGYNYNEYLHTNILRGDNQSFSITENINIVTDRTNYVIMFVDVISDLSTGIDDLHNLAWGQCDNNYWCNVDNINFVGTMIPPIANYEYIDIPNLMFNILTLPFSFISTAFNITIFPGTPYQINISALILSIIGVLVFIFILKQLVKLKG